MNFPPPFPTRQDSICRFSASQPRSFSIRRHGAPCQSDFKAVSRVDKPEFGTPLGASCREQPKTNSQN